MFFLFLFYCFGCFVLLCASMVVFSSNAVYSVLFLILVFCNAVNLLFLLGAEFLGLLFIIVYVGAIAVLFLFVVMMLNIKTKNTRYFFISLLPLCLLLGILLLFQLLLLFNSDIVPLNNIFSTIWLRENKFNIVWFDKFSSLANVETIGLILYTSFSYLFILCSLILLLAMIAVIIITLHQHIGFKKQSLNFQLSRDIIGIVRFNKINRK